MERLLRELKRRHVFRVAAVYAVVAWVVIQVANVVFPRLDLPGWTVTFVIVLLALGFPVALVLAWAFEMTPEGVRRTPADEAPGAGEGVGGEAEAGGGERPGARRALGVLVALGLAAGAVAGGWYLLGGGGSPPEAAKGSVAVLPFQVSGSGAGTWRDGMVTMLSTGLDGAAGLRAIPDRTIFAAWSERRGTGDGEGASTREALSVAREVGARFAVVGSAVKLGERLRLVADLHDTPSGDRLGRVQVEGASDSVTALSDSLTRALLGLLLEEGDERMPTADLASRMTGSLPALEAYLAGERHYRDGAFETALEDYHRAVARDSGFALAYWRLASASGWLEAGTGSRYRRRAHELSDRLPRRERRLLHAMWLYRERGQAVPAADTLRRLTRAYPDDPWVWFERGDLILHAGLPGGWPEADRAFRRAVELDPGHGPYHLHPIQLAFSLHRDSALAARRAARHPNPAALEPWSGLAADLVFGGEERRARAVARIDSTQDLRTLPIANIGASLWHPASQPVAERVLRTIPKDPNRAALLVRNLLRRGRIEAAVEELGAPPSEPSIACALVEARSHGLPVPEAVAREHLGPLPPDPGASPARFLCAGVYLVEAGRGGEAEDLVDRLRSGPEEGAEPDRRARLRDAADVVAGYRAWRRGELERAARLLARSVQEPRIPVLTSRALWRGDVFRELGDPQRAESWYRANWWHPLAQERLGRVYEETGRPEEAAAAYRRFLAAWEEADAPVSDRVEGVQQRLRALEGSGDEG